MGSIYSNSLITTAATGAKDSSQGCSLPRSDPLIKPVMVEYQIIGSDKIGQFFVGPQVSEFDKGIIRHGPLSLRGWTLQEFLLSRRIVHYGKEQIYWECQLLSRAEDGAELGAYSLFKQLLNFQKSTRFNYSRSLENHWLDMV